jgi:hypothetical protein
MKTQGLCGSAVDKRSRHAGGGLCGFCKSIAKNSRFIRSEKWCLPQHASETPRQDGKSSVGRNVHPVRALIRLEYSSGIRQTSSLAYRFRRGI